MNSWRETYGAAHAYEFYEANLGAVATALVGKPLPELGGKSFRELVGFTVVDENSVTKTRNDLLNGSNRRQGIHAS